ncbi:MAG: TonB-dependent receptor [Pyrinomonadaceae bacterium]|nr:TonB-dependent receptor [Pyrinomonadaceae bacterium]
MKPHNLLRTFALACVLLCALVFNAQGQQRSGRISGRVMDSAGAPVTAAEVTLRGEAFRRAQRTDEEGSFAFNVDERAQKKFTIVVRVNGFALFERGVDAGESLGETEIEIRLTPAPLAEEVTITASRTERLLSETAAAVRVLSSSELRTTAAVSVDDALRQVPGFTLFRRAGSRTANPTAQGVSLRGTGASGASRALVLFDGVPLNDPFGGWVYWGRVPRESVGRIEVLRGAASSLYGSAAIGGVVQILTRPPQNSALSLEASYGSGQTPQASLFASERAGNWGVALAAETFHTDGYRLVDKQERGLIDTPAGSKHQTLDLILERILADESRFFVRGAYYTEDRANGTPLQINSTVIRQLSAGLDLNTTRAGNFTIRFYGGTQNYNQNFSAVASDRNSESLTRTQAVPAQVIGAGAQWVRNTGSRNTVVAGFDAREVRGRSDERIFVAGRLNSFVSGGGRERTIGVFAEDIWQISSRLNLTFGARFDCWRNYRGEQTNRLLIQTNLPATITAFAPRTETAFSPRAAARYKLTNNISLSALVSRAFRQPTLNELYRSFRVGDALTLANENLRAERATSAEAGASFNLFDGRLAARASFFSTKIDEPIANVTLRVTPTLITRQRQNLGATRTRGFESEADFSLSPRWTLSGGYLLADARVTEFPTNTALEGLRIPQVARHQLTFQMRYNDPSLLNFSLQGRAASNQFDDDQNRFPLGSYFTMDALASRDISRNIEAFVAIENLFNNRYATGRTPVTTISPPFFARVGLRLRFGAR